jgi:hypothetical protein
LPSLLLIVRRALRLAPRERLQAARALAWILLMRVLLRAVPYTLVRRLINGLRVRRPTERAITPQECARAIRRAARLAPRTRCLARALAAECVLRRDGHSPRLTLGVALDETRRLHAHAWLESHGIAVTGGDEAIRYAPLAPPSAS